MMNECRESDSLIVSVKSSNKICDNKHMAEKMEKRRLAKGNLVQTTVTGTQGPEAASNGLDRVREATKTARGSIPWWGHHKVP